MKISNAITGYFLDRTQALAPTTQAIYERYMNEFATFANDSEITNISKADINRFLKHLSNRGLSGRTVYDVRARLSTLFAWAVKEGLVTKNIVADVERPRRRKPEIDMYSEAEIDAMLEAARWNAEYKLRGGKTARNRRPTALRDVAIIATLLSTGIRASELCNLIIDDYDQKKGQLLIREGKGSKGRFVVLGKRGGKALWKYMASRPGAKPSDPLFETESGEHMDRSGLFHMLQRTGKRAGVKRAGVHRFRHTFAVLLLRSGANVFQLQQLMGHEKIATLQAYVTLAKADIEAAAEHSPADFLRIKV